MNDGITMKEHRSQLQSRALTLMAMFQMPLGVRIQMDRESTLMECLVNTMLGMVCSAAYTMCSKNMCFLQEKKSHLHAEKCIVIKHFKSENVLGNMYNMACPLNGTCSYHSMHEHLLLFNCYKIIIFSFTRTRKRTELAVHLLRKN